MKNLVFILCMLTTVAAQARRWTTEEVKDVIRKVNTYWQTNHPAEVRTFWDHAAYHTGNMKVYQLLGLLWGVNNGYLSKKEFGPTIEKAWNYLTTDALQNDGKIGYVQPIGERAISGQKVDADYQTNFGVGAFLFAACEYVRYISQ